MQHSIAADLTHVAGSDSTSRVEVLLPAEPILSACAGFPLAADDLRSDGAIAPCCIGTSRHYLPSTVSRDAYLGQVVSSCSDLNGGAPSAVPAPVRFISGWRRSLQDILTDGAIPVWKASVQLVETIRDAAPSPSSKASRKRPLSPPASPPTQEPAAASAASRSVGFIILCLISREVRRLAASRYGTSFSCITYADQRSYVSHLNRGETISVLPSITAYCVTSSVWTPLDLSTNGTWL